MKNLKKILLSLMVLFLAFAFIGCPAEPDPVTPVTPEPETPVNNFNGKTFIGMEGEGEDVGYAGYIIFTSDKDCEVCFYGMTIPATYTVADDVVTLTGTGDYAKIQLSTTPLTNGTFKITIPPAVSQEEEDIVVSFAVGTLWTVLYDIPDSDEDLCLKMPEKYLEYYVQQFKLVDGDYTKDDAAKTITLKASGWEKVKPVPPQPEPPVVTNNFMGKTFLGMTGEGEEAYYAGYIIFTSDKDCEVMFFDEEPMPATYTVADDVVTLTGTGEYAALQLSTTKLTDGTFEITIPAAVAQQENDIVVRYAVGTLWTILYEDSDDYFSLKIPEEELEYYVGIYGFDEADYNRDDAEKTITLTASGWTKVQAAMGGGSGGDDSSEEWTVQYPEGAIVKTFASFEEAEAFASDIDLVVTDDYTVNSENQTIILTVSGWEKVQAAMAGGSDDETWTVLDPEGIPFTTFESYEEVQEYLEENELELGVDYTMDEETHTIRHLPKD